MTLTNNSTTKPRHIVVVGAGYFSQFHLDGWMQIPGVQVIALCDTDTNKAAELAKRYGIPKVYAGVADMMKAESPDLVDVVAPPVSHASILEELFKYQLPIICQKPFGINFAQAMTLTEMAKASGSMLIVHENFRFMPCYREMRRLIDAGQFGRLHNISFRLRTGDGQGSNAYLDRQPYFQTMPRFLVVETAIHFIDTFRYLVGEVVAVYARLRKLNPVIAGEDAGLITFEFANGAAGIFDGNRLNDHSAQNPRRTLGEMWLEGSAGVMRLDGDARLWWKPHHSDEQEHLYNQGVANTFGGGACGALQAHVLDALANNRACENTAQAYLRNIVIQEAVYASHASGCRITLDTFSPTPLTHAVAISPSLL